MDEWSHWTMKIFISSTFRDLKEEREKIHHYLKKAGLESLGMEFFVAESDTPKGVCLQEVQAANLILLIVTDNYGTIDEETKKSFTHLEFEKARESRIKILAFLQNEPKDSKVIEFQSEIRNSGITVDFFNHKEDLFGVLFSSLQKYLLDNGYLKNKTKTFCTFAEFYAKSFQNNSLFNLKQRFIGRNQELQKLDDFIEDPKQQIIVISGAGGMGKSKLVYEFAHNIFSITEWEFRFVPSQVKFDNNSVAELPAHNTCIVIEDAHKQTELERLVYSVLNESAYSNKIIITTRPSGCDSVKECLRSYPKNETIDLGRLSKDDSIGLSKTILEGRKQDYAEAICRVANGNTLVIVIASELVQNDQLQSPLIEDGTFREKVLDKLLFDFDKIDNRGVDLRNLFAIIAALLPIERKSVIEILSKDFKVEKYVLEQIFDDLETHGFVVEIGNRSRIAPDILADYILREYIANQRGQSAGFIESIYEKYGENYLGNILVNISEIEYDQSVQNLSVVLWDAINKKLENCTFQKLNSVLKTIEPVSYLSPQKVYEIVNGILEGNTKISKDETSEEIDPSQILNSIIKILYAVGRRPEFTKRACLSLWGLVTEPDHIKHLNKFSENPCTSFAKLASFDNNNWTSVQKEVLAAVREIINTDKHIGNVQHLCQILESSLASEVEIHNYSKRTFSIGWFCIFDVDENTKKRVIEIRNKAFGLYDILIDKAISNSKIVHPLPSKGMFDSVFMNIKMSSNKDLCLIAQELTKKLCRPYIRGGLKDKAKIEFDREANIAIELLMKIISQNNSILNNFIYETVFDSKEHLLERVAIDDVVSEDIKQDYDLFYCIKHDWPDDRDEDFKKSDRLFRERQEATASELWIRNKNDPGKLLNFILAYRNQLEDHGINCGANAFLNACAKVRSELCSKTIEIIIGRNDNDFLASMVFRWIQNAPCEQQYNLIDRVLNEGNQHHKISTIRGLSSFVGLTEKETVSIIEKQSKAPEQEIKDEVIHGLGVRCYHKKIENELPRILDVICDYDTQNNSVRLETLLDNLNPHWIDPALLSDEQLFKLMDKIKYVNVLGGHDTGEFLIYAFSRKPIECTRLILWRINNMSSDGLQPFPYNGGFHEKPEGMINHTDYSNCIREILDSMKKYEWKTYFWCPNLVEWLDPKFSEATKKVLLDSKGLFPDSLLAIAYIFVGYERDYFFNNTDFINLLLQEAEEVGGDVRNTVRGKLVFMPFSGARCIPGLGKDDDLCISIIQKCEDILKESGLPQFIKDFYEDLIKSAKYQNQQKHNRDKAELEEDEF